MSQSEPKFLSNAQAAALIFPEVAPQLAAARMSQLRFRGDGPPYVKIGKRMVRYMLADVLAWAESRKVEPGAGAAKAVQQ